jgi:predicted TIM-barrel fold metal-dependent hydrolase
VTERNPVIDFHVRLAPTADAVPRLLKMMDECGIDRAVVCAGGTIALDALARQVIEGGGVETDADNDAVLTACARADGRLVPFYFGNPHRDPATYADQAARFTGLEVSPAVHGLPLTDERFGALVATAARAGHCVYTVCIERPGCRVADLVTLAERHPDTVFVLGHAGVTPIDVYAVEQLAPHPNMVLETSGGYLLVTREAVRQLGPSRVLFGSEYPLQHPELELAKIRYAELDAAGEHQVFWTNAHRVLGLADPREAPAGAAGAAGAHAAAGRAPVGASARVAHRDGVLDHPAALVPGGVQRRALRRHAFLAQVGGTVRGPGLEQDRVRVTGGHHDAAPVVEGVRQRQRRALHATVVGGRRDEDAVDLVGQLPLLPQRPGGVDELLQLCGRQAVASGRAEHHAVGPLQVIVGGLGNVRGRVQVGLPLRVGLDGRLRGELLDTAQPDLGAGLLRAFLDRGGQSVHIARLAVVDHRDLRRVCHLPLLG